MQITWRDKHAAKMRECIPAGSWSKRTCATSSAAFICPSDIWQMCGIWNNYISLLFELKWSLLLGRLYLSLYGCLVPLWWELHHLNVRMIMKHPGCRKAVKICRSVAKTHRSQWTKARLSQAVLLHAMTRCLTWRQYCVTVTLRRAAHRLRQACEGLRS